MFGTGGATWLPLGPWFLHAALTFCSLFSPILAGPAQFLETMPLATPTPDLDMTRYAMLADQAEEAALVAE